MPPFNSTGSELGIHCMVNVGAQYCLRTTKTSVEFMKALGLAPNLTMKYFTAKAFCAK